MDRKQLHSPRSQSVYVKQTVSRVGSQRVVCHFNAMSFSRTRVNQAWSLLDEDECRVSILRIEILR